ncbi:hypothetical protein ACROYT_G015484 [Oculina patagonica]
MSNARKLKGKGFGISADLPKEIKEHKAYKQDDEMFVKSETSQSSCVSSKASSRKKEKLRAATLAKKKVELAKRRAEEDAKLAKQNVLMDITNYDRGPSYWRFNSSLADDPVYAEFLKDSYPSWLDEYRDITDKRLLWDIIKYRIRKETISYSKRKARDRRDKLSELEKSVKEWEEKCNELPTAENLAKLEEQKIEYEAMYDYITQGAMIRSRARWYEKGEKSNSYFLRLENFNHNKSCIRKIKQDDGNVITEPAVILNQLKSFYSTLYQNNGADIDQGCAKIFLGNPDIPKLDKEMQMKCEGKLTFNECYPSLLSFQNGKAPGNDGLTVEFYKAFWPVIGNLVVGCLNAAHEHGELSTSQKMAIIKLIEKKDKDKMYIANWRPISLINVDVKIASKALAKRLECILPFIIHRNQNAYVKGRLISDSTRIIDDIMSYTKVNDLSGLLVAIDFEKAFDSLDWAFLNKALLAFNFGESFIKWVSTFYCNIKSCVTNNGFSSFHFDVKRGVRQGDPLSPYLFIIALEILAINIRSSKNIKGFKLSDNEEIKLTIFADDLTTFLKDKQSFENLLIMLRDFGCCSGLKVNNGKLEALHLGDSSIKLDIGIKNMDKPLKILGIFFSYDKKQAVKLNFDSILDSLKKTLNLWKWRHLSILGRIQIIKSFAIPKFLYRASQLPFPKDVIKRANMIIYEFIWKGKDKVKRRALINNIENGGLRMIHLESLIQAQKISFLKWYSDPEDGAEWKHVLNFFLQPAKTCLIRARAVQVRHEIDLVDMNRLHTRYKGKVFQYVLSVMDAFSRYHKLVPIERKCSSHVARELISIYKENGAPRVIQQDQGAISTYLRSLKEGQKRRGVLGMVECKIVFKKL